MNSKELARKINNIFLFVFTTLIISGCNSGGGGGPLAFLTEAMGGSSGASVGTGGSVSGAGGVSSLALVQQPEPSSLLLLSSGLIGMAIYVKAKLKLKNKN